MCSIAFMYTYWCSNKRRISIRERAARSFTRSQDCTSTLRGHIYVR